MPSVDLQSTPFASSPRRRREDAVEECGDANSAHDHQRAAEATREEERRSRIERDGCGQRVLVLGGVGFIGRNLVQYMLKFRVASKIRVVDKTPLDEAYLSAEFKQAYENECVEFVKANLSNPEDIRRAFDDTTGSYDVVFNLAAETKYAQPDEVYATNIVQLRTSCAEVAARQRVMKYIEVSTAQVYDGDCNTSPMTKNGKLKPWTSLARHHVQAENAIRRINGLSYVIVRLPHVYGRGDCSGVIIARAMCAAVCQHKHAKKMKFPWGDSLRMHTLHAQDAAAALWYVVCCGAAGETYNVVDDSDMTQGKFNRLLEQLFDVHADCKGNFMSTAASVMKNPVSEMNSSHMEPWKELLAGHSIADTPLTPFLHGELLTKNALCIDGQRIKALGFQHAFPVMTATILRDVVDYWVAMKLFPPVLKPVCV